eukprot:SM000137S00482  [mRNA]  locus=s137:397117:401173:- [translate_table: standard]
MTPARCAWTVKRLAEAGRWRTAMGFVAWLQGGRGPLSSIDRGVCTSLVAALGQARRPAEALQVFRSMLDHPRAWPDLPAYHALAVALGQAGCLDDLLEVIEELRGDSQGPLASPKQSLCQQTTLQPDVVVYNAVLNACSSRIRWQLVDWVFAEMERGKLTPNGATYGLAIEVYMRAGKIEAAQQMAKRMLECGFDFTSRTYLAILAGLAKAGKGEQAQSVLTEMEDCGLTPPASAYYHVACVLCSVGRWQDAVKQVEATAALDGAKPLVQSLSGLMQACSASGHSSDAACIFEHMRHSAAGVNVGACNVMLGVYGRAGRYAEAEELFRAISKGCVSPAQSSGKGGHGLLEPDKYTYEAMLGACVRCARWPEAATTFHHMASQGYLPDARRQAWLINRLMINGQASTVDKILRILSYYEHGPAPELLQLRLQAFKVGPSSGVEASMCYLHHQAAQGVKVPATVWLHASGVERPGRVSTIDASIVIQCLHLVCEGSRMSVCRALIKALLRSGTVEDVSKAMELLPLLGSDEAAAEVCAAIAPQAFRLSLWAVVEDCSLLAVDPAVALLAARAARRRKDEELDLIRSGRLQADGSTRMQDAMDGDVVKMGTRPVPQRTASHGAWCGVRIQGWKKGWLGSSYVPSGR